MKTIEKNPLWLRFVHWANVPLLLLMIWSGLLIYWANPAYPPFFPDWFYNALGIPFRLSEGLWIHFFIAWLFVINALVYLIMTIVTGHWRELAPDRRSLKTTIPTLLHEMGLGDKIKSEGKFNAAQRLAYSGVFALVILIVGSGFAIYKPVQLSGLTALFGGYEGARLVHFAMMLLLVAFTLVHVMQVVRAGWNAFRAMVMGFEVQDDAE